MAEQKSDNSKHTCGEFAGCLVLIIAILFILFWIFVKPKLTEAGYSMDTIGEKAKDLKDSVMDKLESTKDKYSKSEDKLKDAKEEVEESAGAVKDKAEEVKDDLKDKIEDIQSKVPAAKSPKADPELIEG
ncbi:MAG: hypothetical protein WC071_04990 [Victivallaceae bacterium]